jgi:predicted dehydrogenase
VILVKVVIIGLGSMGKRRIRLIKKYDSTFEIYGIDNNEERRASCKNEFGIETCSSLEELSTHHRISCAFICTSPLTHSEIITKCLERKIHVFTELNLVADGYNRNIALANENELVLFMSSTFLYRDEIKRIEAYIDEADCLVNYTYHIGQYLPDWHPWENYKDFFVGNKRSNGCREIFAIELPWLTKVFGDIKKTSVMKSKISNLNVDYNDNYLVLVEHATGHKGMIAVDVVSRKAVRNLEVFGEKIFLQWDGSPIGLKNYDYANKADVSVDIYDEIDQLEQYSKFVVENAYLNEIVSFFKAVTANEAPIYSFEKDLEILKIIDEIEA